MATAKKTIDAAESKPVCGECGSDAVTRGAGCLGVRAVCLKCGAVVEGRALSTDAVAGQKAAAKKAAGRDGE